MWRTYDVTVTYVALVSCDSVCCMCSEAWSSRWLMTQLSNGQHACVLVFVPMVDILWLVIFNLFSLYLMNFMFHTMLDAVGNILRLHYKSMKCDVSFSQDSISTLFRWGEVVNTFSMYVYRPSHACKAVANIFQMLMPLIFYFFFACSCMVRAYC